MSKAAPVQRDDPEPTGPGPMGGGMRTALTLLLIAHLFAVAIGVLSSARPLSPLRNQLTEVPFIRPYLQLLHMDTAYNFHLTDGLEEDLDHSLLVEPQDASVEQPGGTTLPAIRLPYWGLQPGIRRERLQQLAQRASAGGDGDPVRPLLSKTVGGALLRRAGATDGTYRLRVQRQMMLAREDVDSPRATLSDPYYVGRLATAYEGAIILSGPEVYFLEIAPEAQRAGLRDDDESGAADNGQP